MSTSQALENEVRLALYGITAEALSNVARHANASSVNIHLGFFSGGEIYLIIADNGRGFDPDDIPPSKGLPSMVRDAESVGGRIEVDSTPGWGAMVEVCLPRPPHTTVLRLVGASTGRLDRVAIRSGWRSARRRR